MTTYTHLDVADLIDFARVWADLGTSVQHQVVSVLDGSAEAGDINENAIRLAHERLLPLAKLDLDDDGPFSELVGQLGFWLDRD